MRIAVLGLLLMAGTWGAGNAAADPIPVTYVESVLESAPGVDQGLPIYLSQDPNNVRFKFYVPDYLSLVSLNSVMISVDVYDNSANNFEQGDLLFVFNGVPGNPDNLTVGGFGGLSGYTDGAPLTVTGSVSPGADLDNALLEIQGDGIFFIRVNRRGNNKQGNDFYVTNPVAVLDGELAVPEPGGLPLLGLGLAGFAGLWKKTRRA